MLFSSSVFLHCFLPLVLAIYFVSPIGLRNAVLLSFSLLFYAWGEPKLLLLMLGSTVANYAFGLWVGSVRETPRCRLALSVAVGTNLLFLASFKYAAFFVDGLNLIWCRFFTEPLPVPEIALPLGISFYTFHAISYVVDIARGDVKAERHLSRVALYIALFPQLVAGPIVRYLQVADEIRSRRETVDQFAEGVRRFIIGLGKKMLIANPLAVVADSVFDIPDTDLNCSIAWLGIACYTLQIYFDFSGYSDMANGLGAMFGFVFPENFNYPYISRSMTEFWRRWHMSLSSWFREYLYIPLGGNRCSPLRTSLNLLIVFLLCGLWHGASINFVLWGLFHGGFLMIERLGASQILLRLWAPLRHLYLILTVMGGWVLFRADNLNHAMSYYAALAGLHGWSGLEHNVLLYWDSGLALAFICGVIGSTPLWPWIRKHREELISAVTRLPPSPGWHATFEMAGVTLLATVLLASSAALAAGTHNPFIYFRF